MIWKYFNVCWQPMKACLPKTNVWTNNNRFCVLRLTLYLLKINQFSFLFLFSTTKRFYFPTLFTNSVFFRRCLIQRKNEIAKQIINLANVFRTQRPTNRQLFKYVIVFISIFHKIHFFPACCCCSLSTNQRDHIEREKKGKTIQHNVQKAIKTVVDCCEISTKIVFIHSKYFASCLYQLSKIVLSL